MKETPRPLIVCAITQSGLCRAGSACEGIEQRGVIVAIDLDDVPAEGAPLVRQRLEIVGLGDGGALLQAVAVDDQGQVGELAVAGGHRRLPVAAFLQLAVAGDDEGAEIGAVHLPGDGDADRDRQAVAERPGIGLDAGNVVAVRMAVQLRQRLHVGGQHIERDEAGLGQRRVERAGAVALAQDEAVAAGIARPLRIVAQHAEIEGRQNVGDRHVAAGMAKLRLEHHRQRAAADAQRLLAHERDPGIGLRARPIGQSEDGRLAMITSGKRDGE